MNKTALGLSLLLAAGCTLPSIGEPLSGPDAGATEGLDEGEGEITAQIRCVPSGNRYSCRPPTDDRHAPRIGSADGDIYWALALPTKVYDGFGQARAVVTDSRGVKINYGMRKAINGLSMIYVWSVVTDEGTVSGWIPEIALARWDLLRLFMPTIQVPYPARGFYQTEWIVTGGDPAAYAGMKVQRGYSGGGRAVGDYLRRQGGVVNLVFNVPGNGLGGFATDTVPIGTVFHRAKGVLQVDQPYYVAGGSAVRGHIQFIYGGFWDGAQPRFGWIAKQALAPSGTVGPIAPDPAEPTAPDPNEVATAGTWAGWGVCGVRCCDDSLASFVAQDQSECRASYDICSTHGKTKRMRYNDALIYQRQASCN